LHAADGKAPAHDHLAYGAKGGRTVAGRATGQMQRNFEHVRTITHDNEPACPSRRLFEEVFQRRNRF
jgi:hypothetical protein